jgi:hypothetical protein
MSDNVSGTSVWFCLFAGATIAGTAATGGALPLAATAVAAITGNIAAAKIQAAWDAWMRERVATQAAGTRPDTNHDEALAIRKAQMSALKVVVRAVQPPFKFLGDNKAHDLCARLLTWAGKAIDQPNAQMEQKLRDAHPGALAKLTGDGRSAQAIVLADALEAAAAQAMWAEIHDALTIKDLDLPVVETLKANVLAKGAEGWFDVFTRQWHDTLKSDERVFRIISLMRAELLAETVARIDDTTTRTEGKVDALSDSATRVEAGVVALAAGVEAIPDKTARALVEHLKAEGLFA